MSLIGSNLYPPISNSCLYESKMGEQRGCIVSYSDLFVFLKVLPTTPYRTVTTRYHKETNTKGNKDTNRHTSMHQKQTSGRSRSAFRQQAKINTTNGNAFIYNDSQEQMSYYSGHARHRV